MATVFSFALGNLWRWDGSKNRNTLINYVKKLDISGVELTFPNKEELFAFRLSKSNIKWLRNLEYVTIHAPFTLFQDAEDKEVVIRQLDRVSELYKQINAKNVVIHPAAVMPYPDLLKEYDFNVAVENLPPKSAVSISGIASILNNHPHMGFCLDVAHAYLWSKFETGKLIEAFRDRICQIHFSGTYRRKDHQSLRKVSKAFLSSIRPVIRLEVPIVIEEDMPKSSMAYVKEEIEYIKKLFSNDSRSKKSNAC